MYFYRKIFIKEAIPDDSDQKIEFSKKLMKYRVSLLEYSTALQQDEIR